MLRPLDYISSNSSICKCISVAHHCMDIVCSSVSPQDPTTTDIMPNSGNRKNFLILKWIFKLLVMMYLYLWGIILRFLSLDTVRIAQRLTVTLQDKLKAFMFLN